MSKGFSKHSRSKQHKRRQWQEEESRERTTELLDLNQAPLSAIAWDGYLKHGRGIVIGVRKPVKGETHFWYFPASELAQEKQKLPQYVKTYDPKIHVIVAFLNRERNTGEIYRLTPPIPPPKCSAELRGRMSEFGEVVN